ncbi:hypothetical protein M422DRAFT_271110 [Sphaerobolus stellatus SS14]|uniref:CCHC-type domain-containing protein n=1 Tax=Sphaerobolus stellatus (strain SS14) TaxID=990650 RepID=A0A0C9UF90_SPHS4|nr:hypothetical protein M422DRAFT_271110 [Sphaerobolus stellatus SS14]
MREHFYESTQGKRPIRDYIRHLRSLASRVPELNDFSMVQQLVKSAAPYLQIKWAEAGFSQDFTSLHEYEEAGYRFEQAEEVRIFLERRLSKEQTLQLMRKVPQHTTSRREEYPRPSTSYQPRNNPNRQFRQQPSSSRPRSPNFKQYTARENPRARFRDRSHPNRPYNNAQQSRYNGPILSPQERDVLRANNQCFHCKEKGHLAKDCPQRNSVRPPGIQASAARIINTARKLDSIDSIDMLHCNMIQFTSLSFSDSNKDNFDAYLIAQSDWDRIAQELHFLQTFNNFGSTYLVYNFVYYLSYPIVTGPIELLSEQVDFEEEIRVDMKPSLPVPYIEYFWIDASIDQKFNVVEDTLNNPLQLTEQHLRLQEIYIRAQTRRKVEQEAYSPYPRTCCISETKSSSLSQKPLLSQSPAQNIIDNGLEESSLPDLITVSNSSRDDNRSGIQASDIQSKKSLMPELILLSTSSKSDMGKDSKDLKPMSEPLETLSERYERITGRIPLPLHSAAVRPGINSNSKPISVSETKLEQNNSKPKDPTRHVPKPLIITIKINGQPARALVDSGSLLDFVSTTLVDQLKLPTVPFARPQPLQYNENYDVLLGTPFLFQHGVMLGFNPTRIAVGSNDSQPIRGPEVSKLASMASQIISEGLVELRKLLRAEAADLCKTAGETPLPPLRAINHRIPLLDSTKTYK